MIWHTQRNDKLTTQTIDRYPVFHIAKTVKWLIQCTIDSFDF